MSRAGPHQSCFSLPCVLVWHCPGVVRTIDGGDFEDVRVQRLFAELGVMWAYALEISANGTGFVKLCAMPLKFSGVH